MAFYDNFHQQRAHPTAFGMTRSIQAKLWLADLMLKHAPGKPPHLLEIGPGKGVFARHCGKKFQYEAIEANQTMANALCKSGFSIRVGALPGLSENEKYDAIYMDQVFEHFASVTEQFAVLQECRQALVPGGVLLISAPDFPVWREFFFTSDYTHNAVTSMSRARQMLFDANFELLETHYMALGFRGSCLTSSLACAAHLIDATGLLNLAGRKREKILSTLLRSFVCLARRPLAAKANAPG